MSGKRTPTLTQRLRLRLIVAIPTTLVLFTLSSGIMAVSMARKLHPFTDDETLLILTLVAAMAGGALLCGVLLTFGITRPLREMTRKGARILPPSREEPSEPSGIEISDLDHVFDQISFSLNRFIQDHQILENMHEGLITIDLSGRITSCNKVAEKFLGPGMVGRLSAELLPPLPENQPFLSRLDSALKGEDGVLTREETIRNPEQEGLTLWISLAVIKEPPGLIVSIKDLREFRAIRDQIRHTEALAGLGTLTSSLSHEIRNPLGAIRGMLEFLQREIPVGDPKRTFVDRGLQEVGRLAHLTEEFLDLLHVERMERLPGVDVNAILRHNFSLAREEFKQKGFRFREEYGEDLPLVEGDVEKLSQAFLNILRNAFQETPEGGTISVASARAPAAIALRFHNTGTYIPPEMKERLFQAFFTTKTKGTGLGLFLTKTIITAHFGTIDVESGPEEGTAFRVTLPLPKGESVERKNIDR